MSVLSDSETPWTVAHLAPLSLEFSRQEYWRGLPFSPPGDLPHPGIEPTSLVPPALAGRARYYCAAWEAHEQRSLGVRSPWTNKRVGHDLVTKQQR